MLVVCHYVLVAPHTESTTYYRRNAAFYSYTHYCDTKNLEHLLYLQVRAT